MGRKSKQKSERWLVEGAQPADAVPRRLRVETDVHQQLVLGLRELGDRRLRHADVTRVEMTDDLRLVSVYLRVGAMEEDSVSGRQQLIAAMVSASRRLRRHLGQTLSLRYTPELRFFHDDGLDAAHRVDELLAEIAAEQQDHGADEVPPSAPPPASSDAERT